MSRNIARILITGEREDLQRSWRSVEGRPRMLAGAIVLEPDSPHYSALRQLFAREQSRHALEWHETRDIEWERADLERCEILALWITESVPVAEHVLQRVYPNAVRCAACGVERPGPQAGPLVLERAKLHPVDLQRTDHHELLASWRVRELIQTHAVPGLRLESVVLLDSPAPLETLGAGSQEIFQVHVEATLGPLCAATPILREGRCPHCGEYRNISLSGPPEQRLLRFSRDAYHGEPIARTQETFGAVARFPRLIVSRALHELLERHGMTGYQIEPAVVVPSEI